MMTRKTRLTMIGLILLIILLLLLWGWLSWRPRTNELIVETEPVSEEPEIIEESGPSPQQQQLAQEQETRNQASSLTTVAKSFVERYGSYSNEAQFQNLIDVYPLMSDAFIEQTKKFVEDSTLPETYYGVTTQVLTVTVEQLDEEKGDAVLLMQTQREISEGSTQNTKTTYQQIRLELKRDAGVWKVDSASWL